MMDKLNPITTENAIAILNEKFPEFRNYGENGITPFTDFGEDFQKFTPERYELDHKEALTFLLLNNVISFVNNNWWEDEWPEEAKKQLSLCVNLNDTFVYACSDSEAVLLEDIKSLLLWYLYNQYYGTIIWASIKRNEKPLVEYVEWMEKSGIPFNQWASEWCLEDNHCNKIVPRW